MVSNVDERVVVKERSIIQRALIPSPSGKPRLLEPGWAGELAPDELEFLQAELSRDKKLAFQWGFRPGAKRRPEWAIRKVPFYGDPDRRATKAGLARRKLPVSRR